MRRLLGLGALVGMLVLAACSGGGSASTATTTGLGISTTTVPKFSGSANSKYCSVARQFSSVAQANLASDPKTLFQEFDTLAGQYLAVVPAVIKADANTLVSAIQQLETAVKAANYDLTKVSPAALAPVQAPMFTTAANRIDAYDSQVCGLTTTST